MEAEIRNCPRKGSALLLRCIAIALASVLTERGFSQTQPTAPSISHKLPLTMTGSWATVFVTINHDNTPLRFVLDTAAGATVIDHESAKNMGLLAAGTRSSDVQGAQGAAERYDAITIDQLTLGDVTVRGLSILTTNMSQFNDGQQHYDGILGNDFLRRFSSQIDVPGGLLTLTESETPQDSTSRCLPSLPGFPGFAIVRIALSSTVQANAVIDTGAASTYLNWNAARAIGLTPDSPQLIPRKQKSGGFNASAKIESYDYVLPAIGIGGWTVRDVKTRISDLSVFEALKLSDAPAVILGINVLREHSFTITRGVEKVCLNDEPR